MCRNGKQLHILPTHQDVKRMDAHAELKINVAHMILPIRKKAHMVLWTSKTDHFAKVWRWCNSNVEPSNYCIMSPIATDYVQNEAKPMST